MKISEHYALLEHLNKLGKDSNLSLVDQSWCIIASATIRSLEAQLETSQQIAIQRGNAIINARSKLSEAGYG